MIRATYKSLIGGAVTGLAIFGILAASMPWTQIAHAIKVTPIEACGATQLNQFALGIGGAVNAPLIFSVPVSEVNEPVLMNLATIAGMTASQVLKDCFIDEEMWKKKQKLTNELTKEITGYIETSHLTEHTSFIQEPVEWFARVSDWGVDRYINTTKNDERICDVFRADIKRRTLEEYMTPAYERSGQGSAQCTHVAAGLNWGTFVDGGQFNAPGHGVPTFFAMLADSNNPIGSYFDYNAEMAARVSSDLGAESSLLAYGDGFHPDYCGESNIEGSEAFPIVCNPGRIIEGQLQQWLGSPLKQMEHADEMVEIVNSTLAGMTRDLLVNNHLSVGDGAGSGFGSSWGFAQVDTLIDRQRAQWEGEMYGGSPSGFWSTWQGKFGGGGGVSGSGGGGTNPGGGTTNPGGGDMSLFDVLAWILELIEQFQVEDENAQTDTLNENSYELMKIRQIELMLLELNPNDPDYDAIVRDAQRSIEQLRDQMIANQQAGSEFDSGTDPNTLPDVDDLYARIDSLIHGYDVESLDPTRHTIDDLAVSILELRRIQDILTGTPVNDPDRDAVLRAADKAVSEIGRDMLEAIAENANTEQAGTYIPPVQTKADVLSDIDEALGLYNSPGGGAVYEQAKDLPLTIMELRLVRDQVENLSTTGPNAVDQVTYDATLRETTYALNALRNSIYQAFSTDNP